MAGTLCALRRPRDRGWPVDHLFDGRDIGKIAIAWVTKRAAQGRAKGHRWPEALFRFAATHFVPTSVTRLFSPLAAVVPAESVELRGTWSTSVRRTYEKANETGAGVGPLVNVVDARWDGRFVSRSRSQVGAVPPPGRVVGNDLATEAARSSKR